MGDRTEPTPVMLLAVAAIEKVMTEVEDPELTGLTVLVTVMEHLSEVERHRALTYLTERYGRRN